MRRKTLERFIKKVHEINDGPLGEKFRILKNKPLVDQANYNPKLREWYGPKDYDEITIVSGILEAFKESQEWKDIGTISIHDYKLIINDTIPEINTGNIADMIAERVNDGKRYELVFYREFIGEVHIGLRPKVV